MHGVYLDMGIISHAAVTTVHGLDQSSCGSHHAVVTCSLVAPKTRNILKTRKPELILWHCVTQPADQDIITCLTFYQAATTLLA